MQASDYAGYLRVAVDWALLALCAAARQHAFLVGWRGRTPRDGEPRTVHNRWETVAFEAHQAAWLCVQAWARLGPDAGSEATRGLIVQNALALLLCVTGYSEWSKYGASIVMCNALQTAPLLGALAPRVSDPPVRDWGAVLVLSFLLLFQLPALVVHRVHSADDRTAESVVRRVARDQPAVFFSAVVEVRD